MTTMLDSKETETNSANVILVKSRPVRFSENHGLRSSQHSVETPASCNCALWKFSKYGFYLVKNCHGNAASDGERYNFHWMNSVAPAGGRSAPAAKMAHCQ